MTQEMSGPVADGNGAEAGHIISTTIGGKNGEPKQACIFIKFCVYYVTNLNLKIDSVP